jgi:hypothetical protein
MPPDIGDFISTAGADFSFPGISIQSEKLAFDKHYLTLDYTPTEGVWQPLGHKYQWGDTERTRCFFFGPFEDIVRAEFVHVHLENLIEAQGSIWDAYTGVIRKTQMAGRIEVGLARKKDGVVGIR